MAKEIQPMVLSVWGSLPSLPSLIRPSNVSAGFVGIAMKLPQMRK